MISTKPHAHGSNQVELHPSTRGMRQRKDVARPSTHAAQHAGNRRGDNSKQNPATHAAPSNTL